MSKLTSEEREARLQPWLDFIFKHNLDVNVGEVNNYETNDLSEYEVLYNSYIASGHCDFFHRNFKTRSQGIGIGSKLGTQIIVTYTGDKCDLNNLKIDKEQENE